MRVENPDSLISSLQVHQINELIDNKVISSGMIPKLKVLKVLFLKVSNRFTSFMLNKHTLLLKSLPIKVSVPKSSTKQFTYGTLSIIGQKLRTTPLMEPKGKGSFCMMIKAISIWISPGIAVTSLGHSHQNGQRHFKSNFIT